MPKLSTLPASVSASSTVMPSGQCVDDLCSATMTDAIYVTRQEVRVQHLLTTMLFQPHNLNATRFFAYCLLISLNDNKTVQLVQ